MRQPDLFCRYVDLADNDVYVFNKTNGDVLFVRDSVPPEAFNIKWSRDILMESLHTIVADAKEIQFTDTSELLSVLEDDDLSYIFPNLSPAQAKEALSLAGDGGFLWREIWENGYEQEL